VNGFTCVALLAVACWLLRLTFIVFLPVERLPARITAALAYTRPAVLGALVSTATMLAVRGDPLDLRLVWLGCVTGIAALAWLRPSPALSAALGLAAVLLIDLVLVR
jgi:branched-subunit amino acid transport protein